MEILKRKILLEDSTDRNYNSSTYGVMTATSFYIKVLLTQNMDDMGLFTDVEYIPSVTFVSSPPDYSLLINKLIISGITFPFMTGGTPSIMTGITGTTAITLRLTGKTAPNYYFYSNQKLSGATDTKIDDVKSYKSTNPYRIGFDTAKKTYINYAGTIINGVNRVFSIGEPSIYVFDTLNDTNIGTNNQITGLLYKDYTGITRTVTIDSNLVTIPLTTVEYIGEGWNQTNVSLSALTKEEYLFGIISTPEVESDVFIDRGTTTVMELHLKLSEIKNLGQLDRYGNKFYNLTKQ